MSTSIQFPRLKTGVVAQYPVAREFQGATQVVRFLDGSEQRYRDSTAVTRRWIVEFKLLTEAEIGEIDQFFTERAGRFGSFEFTDPADGAVYGDCSIDEDEFEYQLTGEGRMSGTVVIRENRP